MTLSDSWRSNNGRRRSLAGSRRGAAVATIGLMAVVTTLLSACSAQPKPVSSEEASVSYPVVLGDVQSALRSAYPDLAWDGSATDAAEITADNDGGCVLILPTLRSDSSLWAAAGGWKAVMEVVNPVLDEHDFDTVSSEDTLDGGWTGISSSDDSGAEIRFMDKDYTEITLTAPVSDGDCSGSE